MSGSSVQEILRSNASSPQFNIISALELFALKIHKYGIPCMPYTVSSLQIFSTLPIERQIKIGHQISTLLDIFESVEIQTPGNQEIHEEKALVERALDFYGLEFRDDFWKKVDGTDIIEIYNEDQIQIFRTLNFFKITIYSVLDLLVREWYELWERPNMVLQSMQAMTESLLRGEYGGVAVAPVAPHVVKEIYNAHGIEDFQSNAGYVRFKYVCPLFKKGLPIVKGIAITCEVRAIPQEKTSKNLSFI